MFSYSSGGVGGGKLQVPSWTSREVLRATSRQNLYLAFGYCCTSVLVEMVWPFVWEMGLQLNPAWRIRRAMAKMLTIFGCSVALGQGMAFYCFSNRSHGSKWSAHLAHDI
eukprot:g1305.t1